MTTPAFEDRPLDILDVAFVIKGAVNNTGFADVVDLQVFDGEIDFMEWLSTTAAMLESYRLQYPGPEGALDDVVFAYDVAEPFGNALINHIISTGSAPCQTTVERMAYDIMTEAAGITEINLDYPHAAASAGLTQ